MIFRGGMNPSQQTVKKPVIPTKPQARGGIFALEIGTELLLFDRF